MADKTFSENTQTNCTVGDILYYCGVYSEIVEEKYWELNAKKNIVHPSEQDQQMMLGWVAEELKFNLEKEEVTYHLRETLSDTDAFI